MDSNLVTQPGVFLVLHGVDTIARINLNGFFLGETDNMFIRYRFNVRNLLKVSEKNKQKKRRNIKSLDIRDVREYLDTWRNYNHAASNMRARIKKKK